MGAHTIAETKSLIRELAMLDREREGLYTRLIRQPAPDCGHLGDCACWLPTEEEVKLMTEEVARTVTSASECACADGNVCDCDDCSCCKDQKVSS